mgnify:CR=1 FL=1
MFIINYPHIVINLGKIFKVILFVFPIILILSSLEAILTSVSLTTLFPIVNDIINKNDGVVNNSFLNFLSLDQRSLILFLSILIILKATTSIFRKFLSISLAESLRTKLHTEVTRTILGAQFETVNSLKRGVLLEKMSRNTDRTGMLLLKISNFFSDFLMIFFLISTSFFLNWQITIYFLIAVFFLYFVLVKKYMFFAQYFGKQKVVQEQNLTQIISAYLINLKEIILLNTNDFFVKKVKSQSNKLRRIRVKNKLLSFIPKPLIEFLIGLLVLTVFLIVNDFSTFTNYLPSLIVAFAILYKLFNSFLNLTSTIYVIENEIYAYNNVTSLLYSEKKKINKIDNKKDKQLLFKNKIIFKDIEFSYKTKSKKKIKTLNNLNFELAKGSLTLLHGPSGIGKTTVFDLLSKLYYPDSGKIFLDNININEIPTNKIRDLIGYVTQNCSVYAGTFIENIVLNNKFEDKKFSGIVQLCGLEKLFNENNSIELKKNLSGGEIKKIALARILYKEPQILFIDETFSSIEENFEVGILKKLKKTGITILMISHRNISKRIVDNIIYLKKSTSLIKNN